MSAYLIALVDVTDPDKYKNYMALTPAAIDKAGGRFLVRNGKRETLEGPDEERRLIVIEFDSLDAVRAFYDSPDYQAAKLERVGAAEGQFIAIEGV